MNFIVHKLTFPLLDAVLSHVNYVLTFKGRAVMKLKEGKTYSGGRNEKYF